MAEGIVTIGRRQYASGLYWENSPSGRVTQAAKEAAGQSAHTAYYYAIRAGTRGGRIPQFGLSHSQKIHKTGMPSLAGCLANQQPGSWAGAFRLREGVAVVVVRDDLIVPDGDQFFMDEADARDRLLQEHALGGLQRVYAPETWAIPNGDTLPVSLILNDSIEVKLHTVALSRLLVLGGLAGIAAILLMLAIGWYIQEKKAEEERQRLAALEALQQAEALANRAALGLAQERPPYPIPERTWELRPLPLEIMAVCSDVLTKIPLGIAGWALENVNCDGSSATAKWKRAGGFSVPPSYFILSETGTEATQNIIIPSPPTARGKESLWDPDPVVRKYLRENWQGNLTRVPDDPPPLPPPDYKGHWDPPPVPWIRVSFQMDAPVLPWTFTKFFGDLPGVVVKSISYDPNSETNAWSVEGEIYENRK